MIVWISFAFLFKVILIYYMFFSLCFFFSMMFKWLQHNDKKTRPLYNIANMIIGLLIGLVYGHRPIID